MHFSTLLIEPPGLDSQLVHLMLAPEKFRVLTAECGMEAWNMILANDTPDLIVMDADLPHKGKIQITVVQLLELMNNQPLWCNVPKVILTSKQNPKILEFSNNPSVNAIILKPYDPRRFIHEIFTSLTIHIETHIAEINRQHIQLGTVFQELIKLTQQSNRNKIDRAFESLPVTIEKHFKYEEQFMLRHSYPDFIEHHKNHQLLLAMIESIKNDKKTNKQMINKQQIEKLQKDLFEDVNDDKKYINFLYELRSSLIA
ncbi:MAG: hemerythrin domain-containing protein [Candidatus Thiodiazotropha sp. LLP2]